MRATLLLLLSLLAGVASAATRNFVIADVRVNGLTQRPAMIALDGGEILARREDVTGWNLDVANAPGKQLQNVDHIVLTAIPGVNARFDGVTLAIEATESAFQGTIVDMQKKSALSIDGGTGAYVNYDLSSFVSRGQRAISGASLEAVLYADNLSFANSAILSNARPGREFVRYESNLRWDFPDKVQSLVIGDAIARSGAVARGFRFGGVSVGTNFATRPDMVTYALPHVPGESRLPTSAELLINGQTNSRFDLAPGPFEISNVPAINGAGEIQLITRDPLGRQQVIVLPYYVTPAVLREGLTDAGFEFGKVREDFGLESFRYGRYFARGQYRRGVTSNATIEGFVETDGRPHVAG
ncbi:MAG: fimbria/pilus outer membrane usher protein, partial [Usitatibacteraceae bacterium]